jgi:hypothetical protein
MLGMGKHMGLVTPAAKLNALAMAKATLPTNATYIANTKPPKRSDTTHPNYIVKQTARIVRSSDLLGREAHATPKRVTNERCQLCSTPIIGGTWEIFGRYPFNHGEVDSA